MVAIYRRAGSPKLYALLRDPKARDGYRRLSTGEVTEDAAQRVAEKLQEEIDRQNQEADSVLWFDASMDFVRRAGLKPSTCRGYVSLIENVMLSSLGNFRLKALTHADLRQFISEKRQTKVRINGVNDRTTKRYVSDSTIRRHLSFISAVYRWVMEQQMAGAPTENPLLTFNRKGLKEGKVIDRHLRKHQFEQILEGLTNPEDKRILLILAGTGLRLGELLELRWAEIDFQNKVIEFGNMDPDRTKSSRARRIPMLGAVHEALTAQCAASFSGDGGYVISSPVGGGKRYSLGSLMKRVRKISGLKNFRIHDLRHTFASWALQKGIDPFAISKVLGHSSLYITSRYARHIPDSVLAVFRTSDFL